MQSCRTLRPLQIWNRQNSFHSAVLVEGRSYLLFARIPPVSPSAQGPPCAEGAEGRTKHGTRNFQTKNPVTSRIPAAVVLIYSSLQRLRRKQPLHLAIDVGLRLHSSLRRLISHIGGPTDVPTPCRGCVLYDYWAGLTWKVRGLCEDKSDPKRPVNENEDVSENGIRIHCCSSRRSHRLV